MLDIDVHKSVSHGELMSSVKSAASVISMEKAVKGFLYSISTKDFQYRTALSSLIWARALPEHEAVSGRAYGGVYSCQIFGYPYSQKANGNLF